MKIFLSLLLLASLPCYSQRFRHRSRSEVLQQFYKKIARQFQDIDRVKDVNTDSLEILNKTLIQTIESYKSDIFYFPDTLDYDLIYLTKSADKNFAIVSWNTRLGGTLIAYASSAIYKTPKGVQTKMLGDDSLVRTLCTYIHYNEIRTIATVDSQKIYLSSGRGQGSTALPWEELRAFTIKNTRLVEPPIFPDKSSFLFVGFDLHAFRDDEVLPSISIKDRGKTILEPIATDHGGFSGSYRTYRFNGKSFVKGKT